ncbi:MAG TPA: serine hydrolase [Fodinibius sp.]|nr:serine hydrolase [Fodinibius sp.]
MRILKFLGTFIGALVLVFFIVFGFNLDALVTLTENSDDLQEGQQWVPLSSSLKGLTEYIGANPQHVSLVSQSAINPDTTIRYGADKPRTMGTLSNFFLITTYARLVENDELNPDELITIGEADRYQLPYIDFSNHEDAKSAMRSSKSLTNKDQIPLKDLIQTAVIFSDLAVADFLYYKLGRESINQTYELLSVERTDKPLPFSGLYITINPAVQDTIFPAHFERLQQLSKQEFRDTVLANSRKYLQDKAYRKKIKDIFNASQGLAMQFKERRDALSLFPKSTAEELSGLMLKLEQNELISAGVSKRIKEIMDWPFERQNLNSDFNSYGALYDNRLGLLNGIDYGSSSYSGEPFGQAVFFDSLQVAFWFHMSSNLMHQDYQQRLMWDPALRETTTREVNR